MTNRKKLYTESIFSVFRPKLEELYGNHADNDEYDCEEYDIQWDCYWNEAELFAIECLRRNIDPTLIGPEEAIEIIEEGGF